MIDQNLRVLRKKFHLTQEELAEKLNISRQTLAKWETGVSMPDVNACMRMADFFQIPLEDLIRDRPEEVLLCMAPRGKYVFGKATIGEDGMIRLPPEACTVFQLKAGDSVVILGDQNQGIALLPEAWCQNIYAAFMPLVKEDPS